MAISALEDVRDNFKCITSLVPEGSEVHKALLVINTQIKTAYRVAKSANLTMGTADVAGTSKALGIMLPPGQQLLAPRKKKEKYPQLKVFQLQVEVGNLKVMTICKHKK